MKTQRGGNGARRKSVTKPKKKGMKIDKNTSKQVDKVEAVKVLVSKYGLSNIDALLAYDKFFKKYPTGSIKKNDFLEEYKVLHYLEFLFLFIPHLYRIIIVLQDDIMAEAYFRVFDEDNSGSLSFYEYMLVKTAPNSDKIEDRLGWLFNAFDDDGGGTIDHSEVIPLIQNLLYQIPSKVFKIVEAVYKISNKTPTEEGTNIPEEISDCVEEIIEAVDADGDGIITKEEFVANAMKSTTIAKIMNKDVKK